MSEMAVVAAVSGHGGNGGKDNERLVGWWVKGQEVRWFVDVDVFQCVKHLWSSECVGTLLMRS